MNQRRATTKFPPPKSATLRTRPKAPRTSAANELDLAIAFHRPHTRRVQLWQQVGKRPFRWIHVGRFSPRPDLLDYFYRRFGGGTYRAKLLGPWLPKARREVFLQQISFELGGRPTLETIGRMARLGYRPANR